MVDESNSINDGLERLVNYYRRKILTGQIEDREQLPSAKALAERHEITERAASSIYAALAARGLARQGLQHENKSDRRP